MDVSPYPYPALERVPRALLHAQRLIKPWLRGRAAWPASGPMATLELLLHEALGLDVEASWEGASALPDLAQDAQPLSSPARAALVRVGERSAALLLVDLRLGLVALDAAFGREALAERALRPLSPLEEGLLDALIARTIARLSDATGAPLAVQRLDVNPSAVLRRFGRAKRPPSALAVRLTTRDVTGHVRLILDMSELATLAPHTPPPHSARTLGRCVACCGSAPVAVTLRLGRATLAPSALVRLTPGAVVVGLGVTSERGRLTAALVAGDAPLWRVRLDVNAPDAPTRLGRPAPPHTRPTLTRGRLMSTQHNAARRATPKDAPARLSDDDAQRLAPVPVEVTFELGRAAIPLKTLAALQQGDVVPMQAPLRQPVALVVGQRVWAEGELVDIDGELGVRITRVHDDPSGDPRALARHDNADEEEAR